MRITSGQYRGKILKSPEGLSTRPTSDRARQAVFNILLHAPWCGPDALIDQPVMDIFAGTGALGLEALSRGAGHCVFVEGSKPALAALRSNIAACRIEHACHVLAQDALAAPPRPASLAPRRIVFCDPPYNTATDPHHDLGRRAVTALIARNWLAPGCVVVMEAAKALPEHTPEGCTLIDSRDYGVARVSFLRYSAS